jgi:transposase
MMGRLNHDQEQFFYSFRLDEAVPADHPVRRIAAVLDLSWVYCELAPYYPKTGRPSIDPVLMIRDADRWLRLWYPLGTGAVPRVGS